MKLVIVKDLNFGAEEGFNGLEVAEIFAGAEGEGAAGGTGAGRAPDPVDVGLGLIGHIKIHDQGDVFDIDTAGGDIGGDEDGGLAAAEFIEGALSGILCFIAVDGLGAEAGMGEVAGEPVGTLFGAAKDQGELASILVALIGEEGLEESGLVIALEEAEPVVDLIGGLPGGLDADFGGVVKDFAGQLCRMAGESGGEKEGLALSWQFGDNGADIGQEAHIEHAIGLIEDEVFDLIETQFALAEEVEEATWGGDEDIKAFAESFDLWMKADAAVDGTDAGVLILSIFPEAGGDLAGEFAGGGEDKDAKSFGDRFGGIFLEPLENGQGKGCCFAGTRLGASEHVATALDERDCLRLNGRGRVVPECLKGTVEGIG